MSELSSKAEALVRAGRTALRPSTADRERISAALRARLGDAALPVDAGSSSLLARMAWGKVSAITAAIGVVGGAAWFALREPAPVSSVPAQPDSVARVVESATPLEPASSVVSLPEAPAPSAPEVNAPAAKRPADRLAEEVAILSKATSELHAGRAANALKKLDEHRRKFPNGLLAQERAAARVQALCALGRSAEARPELERLARVAPQSPNTLRAKQVCGATSATK
ncbi:MAG: hypothetical protein QM756_19375 [Polyangiaceae bacterium]